MPILSVQNILLRFGGPPLLDNVSFDIEAGDRICLVGRNGEGKSTLLKVLTDFPSGCRILRIFPGPAMPDRERSKNQKC